MLTLLLVTLLSTAPALGPEPGISPLVAVEDPPLFPLQDVRAGLRGRGYTVFSSDRGPEPFDVVILGVMKGFLGPGEDLIIARLEGEQIEKTGVISGMSGSPVYIDGKLVGAVGYRFGAFVKDPIAGITPIERMMTSGEPAPQRPRRPTPVATPQSSPMTAWGKVEPIAVPVTVSGVSPAVLAAFGPELDKRGYGAFVAAGGNAQDASRTPYRFFAGGPIAGSLVDGDVSMAAIGTVTWVKGNRFLGFGHPFLGSGNTDMPVSNAQIITTVASDAGSWKMGQATAPVGRLSDDRLLAIAGTMGDIPHTVPLTLHIDADSPRRQGDAKNDFTFRVMQHPTDTPLYVAMTVAGALNNRVAAEKQGATVDVHINAKLSTGDTLPIHLRDASDGGFEIPVALALLGTLDAAVEQDFTEVRVQSVDVKVKARDTIERARVVSVDAPRTLFVGEAGDVRVRLQSYKGPVLEKRVRVKIPAGLPHGAYQLVAAGTNEAARVERDGGLLAQPTSWQAHLRNIENQPPPGALSIYLVKDDPTLRVDGRALQDLPASLLGVLDGGGGWSGQNVDLRAVRVGRVLDDGVVAGESTAKVRVRSLHDAIDD